MISKLLNHKELRKIHPRHMHGWIWTQNISGAIFLTNN